MTNPLGGPSKIERRLGSIILGLLAVSLPFVALNQPSATGQEVRGIVQSVGTLPSDIAPPPAIALVRLNDGSLVQARVVTPHQVRPGHVAHLREYRRVLSGAKTYELLRAEPPP